MAKWINTNTGEIVYNNDKEALNAYERTYIENHKLDADDEWLDVCDFSDWVSMDSDIEPDIPEGAVMSDEFSKDLSNLCNKYSGEVTAEYLDANNKSWKYINKSVYSGLFYVDDKYDLAVDHMAEHDAEYDKVDIEVLREKYESLLMRLNIAGLDGYYIYYKDGKCIGDKLV